MEYLTMNSCMLFFLLGKSVYLLKKIIMLLQIRKEDADLFGHELPIPPSCLVTVCGKLSYCQNTEQHLNYSVPLIGINSDEEEIRIDRFLETDPCKITDLQLLLLLSCQQLHVNIDTSHYADDAVLHCLCTRCKQTNKQTS